MSPNFNATYLGQSFTVSGSGSYNNIGFNFYATGLTPYASGTGYLFSTAYTGTPAGLNSSDAGFLGSATASGGFYNFGSSLDLAAGTQYFFYENVLIPAGAVTGGDAAYTGGNFYFTTSASTDFANAMPFSANFDVTGTAVSSVTPEPSSFLLLGTGLLGAAGLIRRRFV